MHLNNPITYQLSTESYGQVRAIPLLLANELNSELERWFQNYKFIHLAINGLKDTEFNNPLQLEYVYSLRTLPFREFKEIKSQVKLQSDLLNYHQLIKIIHKYIELAHKIYLSLLRPKVGTTILDFEKGIDQSVIAFHKKPFPQKLDIITNDLGISSTLEYLNQINRVRNCLEHRSGIVSEHDCDKDKSYMSIKFRYLKLETPDGEITPISDIKGKQNSEPEFTDEEKKIRIGEKVLFDFKENAKLIFSINECFKSIIDGIYQSKNIDQVATPTVVREFK